MKKPYEKMTKKELLKIAKLHGIKGRHKMSKAALIKKIKEKNKPLRQIKEKEEEIKKNNPPDRYEENHVELLPKDASTVYVHWEVVEEKSPVLRLMSKRKVEIEIPLMSNQGEGYLKVQEGKPLRAEVGIKKGNKFKKITTSPEILVPRSKPVKSKSVKWEYVNPETGKVQKKRKKEKVSHKAQLEEKKKKTEKTAKKIKYIRIPKGK